MFLKLLNSTLVKWGDKLKKTRIFDDFLMRIITRFKNLSVLFIMYINEYFGIFKLKIKISK